MDLRFIAVLMAVAIVMDMLGRMAKRRVAEQQSLPPGEAPPPGEGWDMLKALAEADESPRPIAREAPSARQEQSMGGFELWSEPPSGPAAPDSVAREPVIEVVEQEPAFRDRSARPILVRSRDPRSAERRPERAGPDGELVVRGRQLPAPAPSRTPAPPRPLSSRATINRGTGAAAADNRLGLGTPHGLRTAIVAREVLGPPLALRDDDGRIEGR